MKPEFSIIVPFYNTELYIEECIESVLAQTFTNWELILINDGSTDESVEIARKYEHQYEKIKYISIHHSGLPAARNAGLKVAEGDYIAILDSDDLLLSDHFDKCKKMLAEFPCEMLIFNNYIRYWKDHSEKIILFHFYNELNYLPLSMQVEYLSTKKNIMPSTAINTIYSRLFLAKNNITYDERLKVSEDTDFFLRALSRASNIKFADHEFYLYRQDNSSAMTKNMSDEMYAQRISIMGKWIDFFALNQVEFSTDQLCRRLREDLIEQILNLLEIKKDLSRHPQIEEGLKRNEHIWGICGYYRADLVCLKSKQLVKKIFRRLRKLSDVKLY